MAATIFSVLLEIVRFGVVGSGRCWSSLESRHWSDLFDVARSGKNMDGPERSGERRCGRLVMVHGERFR